MTTANETEAAGLAAHLATERAAYAHRYGLPATGTLTADGATLAGTLGSGQAARDLAAQMRRWGGTLTVTEEEDGSLTVAGTLTVTVAPDPPSGPAILFADAYTGDALDASWQVAGDAPAIVAGAGPTGGPALRIDGVAGGYIYKNGLWDADTPIASGVYSVRVPVKVASESESGAVFVGFWSDAHSNPLDLSYTPALGLSMNLTHQDGAGSSETSDFAAWPGSGYHTVELVYDISGATPVGRVRIGGVEAEAVTDPTTPRAAGWLPTGIWVKYGSSNSPMDLGPLTVAAGLQGV